MQKLEFEFADYSPLIPAELESEKSPEKCLQAEQRILKNEEALKKLFGEKKRAELLNLFCGRVNAKIKEQHGDEKLWVDILEFFSMKRARDWDDPKPELFKVVKKTNGEWEWQTQGYVGAIRLRLEKDEDVLEDADVTIRFCSRFDGSDNALFLRYVLEKAFELPSEETKGVVYKDMTVESALRGVFDFLLLHQFFRQLHDALKKGMYRQYQEFSHNDSNVRGRIDIPRHIRENAALQNGRISYVTREYTADNAVNRLILKAAERLERKYRTAYTKALRGDELCSRGLAVLKGELFDRAPVSDHRAIRDAGKKIVQPIYKEYEPLRNTCIAILRHLGEDRFKAGTGEVYGLLLDMPTLWEIFLHNTVFRELDKSQGAYRQKTYKILDGRRPVRPDFLFPDQGIVLDAKYKEVWGKVYENEVKGTGSSWDERTREDILQVIAYMHIFQCKKCGVIFPVRVDEGEAFRTASDLGINQFKSGAAGEYFLLIPFFVPAKAKDFRGLLEKNTAMIRDFLEKEIRPETQCSGSDNAEQSRQSGMVSGAFVIRMSLAYPKPVEGAAPNFEGQFSGLA